MFSTLFSQVNLRESSNQIKAAALQQISQLNEDSFKPETFETRKAQFIAAVTVQPATLKEDDKYLKRVPGREDIADLHIPVDGNAHLLTYQPDNFTYNMGVPVVGEIQGEELVLRLAMNESGLFDSEVERQLRFIRANLQNCVNQAETQNRSLTHLVISRLEERKLEVEKLAQARTNLGIPFRD